MVQQASQYSIDTNERGLDDGVAVSRLLARLADRYVVDRKLGAGGTGVVYLARDSKLGRTVAIKVLHPAVSSRIGSSTFLREVRLTAALQHPHILQVLDSGCLDGVFYYITPYLTEGSLHDLIEQEGRVPLNVVLKIAADVLEALGYAHSKGIIHCDLKPENILLSGGHAVLADFGIARSTGIVRFGEIQGVSGSPAYMSPEQAAGDHLDGRSDLYSFACVLYELLAGAPAFTGPHALAIIAKRFQSPVPNLGAVNPSVPRSVSTAIAKALALDPFERFGDAKGFAEALLHGAATVTLPWRLRLRGWGARSSLGRLCRSALLGLWVLFSG